MPRYINLLSIYLLYLLFNADDAEHRCKKNVFTFFISVAFLTFFNVFYFVNVLYF